MPPLLSERVLPVVQVRAWAARRRLFAVVDACDVPVVPARARDLGPRRAVSLYRGRAEEELWGIAPYLIQADPEVFDWITADLWSTPWGFLALADTSLDALRLHFRRFLVVDTPQGEPWYFRFYDPRVLRQFLPTLDPAGMTDFLGPVRAIGLTDPASYGVAVLTAPEDRSQSRPVRVQR